ncbi:hypothetical protein BZARG_1694 [Bizionia argentinensis JUB59]|uniref:Uncharacterized protein n=1 Tax=Bizionia argentinensis JUB59 TaxID=1046627 RepID=G2EEY0_9FLAO|nr:hypothetical protein [Bizionia argentinensis]EGV43021.1 hypothetical protein BZARG_1694 [Bizionia argentinensis JUB59]
MKKLFSIFILTLFFAGSINAVNLNVLKIEQKEKSCEDEAWDTAQELYETFNDSFIAGDYLEFALGLCE